MKNKILIKIGAGVLTASLIATISYNMTAKFFDDEEKPVTVEKIVDKNKMIEVKEKQEVVEKEFPLNMSEVAVQDAIHAMSHQKVKADEKWINVPMSNKRIKRLLEVVSANEETFNHSKLYFEILKRWEKNDFSEVHIDHNSIWELQGGTVGKAYDILTTEEEKEFIQKNYKEQK